MDGGKTVIVTYIILTIPAPPALISPGSESEPGTVITTTTPTFEWTEVSGATDYGIYIRDLTNNDMVFNSKALGLVITGSSYSLPPGILEMDRAYLWIMTSHNSAGWGDSVSIFYFQTNTPTVPAPPALISPGSESSPGPVNTTLTPTFEWTKVSEAKNYGIYIKDLTANVLVFNSRALGLVITGSSYSLPSGILEKGRDYLWYMTSHNSAGFGDLASVFYFQTYDEATAPTIPEPPKLISPGSESSPDLVINTTTPTLEWIEVSGATDYGIYIRDLAANVLVFNSKALGLEITGSSYFLSPGILEAGGAYLWIMTSHSDAGWGDSAAIFYFQTDEGATAETIPEAPVLISPGSESSPGTVMTMTTPTLEWTTVNEATDYGIYIRDLTSNDMVYNSKALGLEVTGSSYSLPPGILQKGRDYLWIMTSHNRAGWGDSAAIFYFQTDEGATAETIPEAPALISPGSKGSPGPVITTTTPTFEWTEVSEATDYRIYIRDLTSRVLVFNSKALGLEITGSSYSLPSGILEKGRAYLWSMTSHRGARSGDLATNFYFQTDEGATAVTIPEAPSLISPGSKSSPGPVITTTTPTFEWTAVSSAKDYGIYIRDLASNDMVFDSKALGLEITGSSYSLPSGILEAGKAYLWIVTSHRSAGWGDLSTIFYFQTDDDSSITRPMKNRLFRLYRICSSEKCRILREKRASRGKSRETPSVFD